MSDVNFHMIVAHDEERGIGKDGDLAWRIPGDMAYFVAVTSEREPNSPQNIVIMGRRTWDSIPPRYRPFDNRTNIVLTRQNGFEVPEGVGVASSLTEGLEMALKIASAATVYVIGGGMIYREGVRHPGCQKLYITEVEGTFGCDTFFPAYDHAFCRTSASDRQEENGIGYRFSIFERKDVAPDSDGGTA